MSRYGYFEVFQRVPWTSRKRESTVYCPIWSIWMARWLLLPILGHEVLGSKLAGGRIQFMTVWCHCTEPFIITLPSSRYDLHNVKRDVKHQPLSLSSTSSTYAVWTHCSNTVYFIFVDCTEDPYNVTETDPVKCRALESSLWELKVSP